jgi:CubicO group peptidase (beta-lactamase class C family)
LSVGILAVYNMRIFPHATAALGLVASTLAAGQAPKKLGGAEPYPGLDAYVTGALATWNVPGLALAIVRHDSVIYARGYGVRTVGTNDRVDDRTVFAIGSCTKAFTTAALAMLVDEGKVRWDGHVTTYLPGFELADPYVTRELTIRDLVNQRAGLARFDLLWYESDFDRAEIVRRMRFLKQAESFRSQYGYNNLMYLTAGQVVAAASGMSWDDFIQRRIFDPLGMRSSSTSVTALAGHEDVASPHRTRLGVTSVVPWYNIDNVGPAGSINSNVDDMAQWIRLQLGRGTMSGKTLVSAAALGETHTPQTAIPMAGAFHTLFPGTHFVSYAMGWLTYDYRGHVVIWHNGGIDGFSAMVAMLPEDGFGVVVLTNVENTLVYNAVLDWLFDRELQAPVHDWSSDMHRVLATSAAREDSAEARAQAKRVQGTHPTLPLERYAGTYVDSAFGTATVRLENGTLTFRRGQRMIGDLEPWNYDTFRATWRNGIVEHNLLTFDLASDGTVASIRSDIGGDTLILRRVPEVDSTKAIHSALHASLRGQPTVTKARLVQPQPGPSVTFLPGNA